MRRGDMASLNDTSYYTGLITSEHQKTKFIAMLAAYLAKLDMAELLESFDSEFDIETAIGAQLDILGELIGQGRMVNFEPSDGSGAKLSDYNYRFLLKGKIIRNMWNGTMESLIELLDFMFPSTTETRVYYNTACLGVSQKKTYTKKIYNFEIAVVDNQDMTMSIYFKGNIPSLYKELVENGYIIPKPQGVGINYTFINHIIFGYDYNSETVSGYDRGYWYL
jgi:hypothetical protein